MEAAEDRPYRSHLRPACVACRRRKSRCSLEAKAQSCLMCQAHGTDCTFPQSPDSLGSKAKTPQRRAKKLSARDNRPTQSPVPLDQGVAAPAPAPAPANAALTSASRPYHSSYLPSDAAHKTVPTSPVLTFKGQITSTSSTHSQSGLPISLHQTEEEDDSPHIVGPAVMSDSHVLADYLSNVRNGNRTMPMIRPMLGGDTEPVVFTRSLKRPQGITIDPTPPSVQLQMIEKLLEPMTERVVNLYLNKSNICFPLLDEASFRNQHANAKNRISPALLATVYAHSLCYWSQDPLLATARRPDVRFIWDLACQVLFNELRHSPGISTIPAVLLNVGGRPTTCMIGNGVQLGTAVSMSLSLGLNRNPLTWHIPTSEKHLRMKIWWCLLVHDRWSSMAYGTPPRLRADQYDVPAPEYEYLLSADHTPRDRQAASIFMALVSLTETLEGFLDHVYCVRRSQLKVSVSDLELALNSWVDHLSDDVRKIIVRGTQLDTPGASNLRLSYLSTRMLLTRIELNQDRQVAHPEPQKLDNRYMQIRRTAEDIVHLVQELNKTQLEDFWQPIAAFTFSHTVTFLIRCALETENTSVGLSQSPSLRMANELLIALRRHQGQHGWDLADICLSQHAEVVEKLLTSSPADDHLPTSFLEPQKELTGDFPFMDDWLAYTNLDFLPG